MAKTKTITVAHAKRLLESSGGTIFTVTFTKRNGKTQRLNGRTGVTKRVTGRGMIYNPTIHGILPVFDLYAQGYRSVRINALTNLSIRGRKFAVRGGGQF